MAESTDKQTRKIAEKRVEKGKEFEGYQEAQNQLLAIQAEQKQNLALQANEAATMSAQNQTLGQAAEIMAVDEPTQNILSGYGLNQPRVIKNSDVQKQGPNNITINNTTINNTSGPVQGREISIRPQENNQGKFKAWLTNVFARQDAEWQKRNQEYTKRESSLTRNANKMMRKIEGLGKEIGNAVDPRKIANNVSNPLMNLLKSIGLIALAKRLPKILHFIDNAEATIKDWFGGLGDKIKDGFSDIFDINGSGSGFLVDLKNIFYNRDETGVINKLIKWIDETLVDRKRIADAAINFGDASFFEKLSPSHAVRQLGLWLSAFFGGTSAAKSILNFQENADQEKEIRRRNEDAVKNGLEPGYRGSESGTNTTTNDQVGNFRKSDMSLISSVEQNPNYFQSRRGTIVMARSDTSEIPTDETINSGYQQHLKKDDTKNSKVNYLNEAGAVYLGEGAVLSLETKKIVEAGQYHFDTNYLSGYDMNRLKNNNWYAPLSLELQFISDTKRRSIKTAHLIWYLTVLKNTIRSGGPIPVFGEFITLLSNQSSFSLSDWVKENGIETKKFVLLVEPMVDEDRRNMLFKKANGDMGMFNELTLKALPTYLDNYLKIFPSTSATATRKPIALPVPDRQGKKGTKEWSFYMLTISGLTQLLTESIGTSDLNYKNSTQQNLVNSLKKNIINPDSRSFNIQTSNSDYEQRWDNIEAIEREHQQQQLELDLETETENTRGYTQENANKYTTSRRSQIQQNKPIVSYVEKSSDFKSPYSATEQEKEMSPRLKGKSISGVTKAFGGNGTLTSNFMEWRENHRGTNRFHYGIDLANRAGNEVLFPGYGTITATGTSRMDGSYIDVKDNNQYTTRYWHTRLYGGLQVGSQILPGQPIGITEAKGENGNTWDPHIHVEVHDPEWSQNSSRDHHHKHYVNPLVYWNTNKAKPIELNQEDLVSTDKQSIVNNGVPETNEVTASNTNLTPASGGPTLSVPEKNSPIIQKQSVVKIKPISITSTTNPSVSEDKKEELLKVLIEQVSLITQSTDYTARSLSPLVDNMNAGFNNLAQSNSHRENPKTRATNLNTENGGIV